MAQILCLFLLLIFIYQNAFCVSEKNLFPESLLDQLEKELNIEGISDAVARAEPKTTTEPTIDNIFAEVAKLEGTIETALLEVDVAEDFFDFKIPGDLELKLKLSEGPKDVVKVDSEEVVKLKEKIAEQDVKNQTKEALKEYDAVVEEADDFGKIMPALLMDGTGHEPRFIINGQEPQPAMPPALPKLPDFSRLNFSIPKFNFTRPALPGIPNISSVANLQRFPNIPVPLNISNIQMPQQLPNIPKLPNPIPNLPNPPNLPNLQNLPTPIPIPNIPTALPQIPGIPSALPTISGIPKMPGIPNIPIVSNMQLNVENVTEHNSTHHRTNRTHSKTHHKKSKLLGSDDVRVKISASDRLSTSLATTLMILIISLKYF